MHGGSLELTTCTQWACLAQVIKMAEQLKASSASEETVKQLEGLINEAYKEIDKAVQKGVLHKNNAARKKSRCARYKRQVLMAAGLWTPPADHPDYAKFQKLQAKKAAA
jgi:small subunit ribosomal protein S20